MGHYEEPNLLDSVVEVTHHDQTFPTLGEVTNGVDAWQLLPSIPERYYGKRVRIIVALVEMHPTIVPAPLHINKPYGDPCPECRAQSLCCVWCDDEARHLGEGDQIACDKHKPYLIGLTIPEEEELAENDPDELDAKYEAKDIGCFTPGVDGCSCDSWM